MTTTTINVDLSVVPLIDNGVWFANAAAWSNYWATQGFSAIIPVAGAGVYGVVQSAITIPFNAPQAVVPSYTSFQIDITGNGQMTQVDVAQRGTMDAFIAAFNNLLTDYLITKAALKAASIITNN